MTEEMAVTAPRREKNFLERWFGLYFSPSETFASIDRKPDWILPLALLSVISVVAFILLLPIIREGQIQAMMDRQGMTYDQAAAAMERAGVFLKFVTPIFTLVGVWVVALAVSGVFFVVNNYVLGGESSYKKVLSVYSWSAFAVGVIGAIVRVPLVLAKGSIYVQTSLAAFLSEDQRGTFLYRLLSKFDLFTIWLVALLIIGFSVIYRFSRGKSAASVLTLWGIYIVLAVLLGGLFGGGPR